MSKLLTAQVIATALVLMALVVMWAKLRVRSRELNQEALSHTQLRNSSLYQACFPKRLFFASLTILLIAGPLAVQRQTVVFAAAAVVGYWGVVNALFLYAIRKNRLRDRVFLESQRICSACLYSLAGHGQIGRCPECGVEFTPESLRKDWL